MFSFVSVFDFSFVTIINIYVYKHWNVKWFCGFIKMQVFTLSVNY